MKKLKTAGRPTLHRMQPALGTWVKISLASVEMGAHTSISKAFQELHRLEKIFSFFDSESELQRVNRGAAPESIELKEVLKFAHDLEAKSLGAFCLKPDGNAIDLGGVAKGYIVDRIFVSLEAEFRGVTICVNAGGDLRCAKTQTVELQVPGLKGTQTYTLHLQDSALATSSIVSKPGHTARYCKLPYYSTVSVQAPTCMMADAMTKVALFSKKRIQNATYFDSQGGPI